jgi:hypothetical protein
MAPGGQGSSIKLVFHVKQFAGVLECSTVVLAGHTPERRLGKRPWGSRDLRAAGNKLDDKRCGGGLLPGEPAPLKRLQRQQDTLYR